MIKHDISISLKNEESYRKWMGICQQLNRETSALRMTTGYADGATVTFSQGEDELLVLTKEEFSDMSANEIVEKIRKNLGETK